MALFEITSFATLAKLLLAARKLATDPDPLNRAKALADLASNGKALNAALRTNGLSPLAAKMEKIATDRDAHVTHPGPALEDARALFLQAAPHALADPSLLAGYQLDPAKTAQAMLDAVNASPMARDFATAAFAQSYFYQIMDATLAEMLNDVPFVDSIAPDLWRKTLTDNGIQIKFLARIDVTTQSTEAKLDTHAAETKEQLDRLEAMMLERISLEKTKIPKKAILEIVHKIAPTVSDIEDALTQLRGAVDIAARQIARAEEGRNFDGFVNNVLHDLAQRTEAGDLDGAAHLAREKLAEAKAGVAALRDAAIDSALLAQDAESAATLIAERIAEDTPDPAARFEALRAEWNIWYERGRDKGLALDLRVAIHLAEAARDRADGPDQSGAALNNLGNALRTLGDRESGTERLEQAVAAYNAALQERTRERVPLDWATTQNNLGNALRALGEREPGTERLEQAVAAYNAALQERTRERVPLDWATTQNNLGTALQTLGEHEPGTVRLEAAVAAYHAALQETTQVRVPLDWAMTQMNLGNALQTLGEREPGTVRLEAAVAAFNAALQEWTRELVPLDWAMTQGNIANVELAFFDKTRDPSRLDAAQVTLDRAREVYMEAGAGQYLAIAERQQADIDTRRATL